MTAKQTMILKDAEALAQQLMSEHGLSHWHFEFDRAVRRFGFCMYGIRTITLSRKFTLLNSEPEVRNTILHEIAHALVGPNHGHDKVWRTNAKAAVTARSSLLRPNGLRRAPVASARSEDIDGGSLHVERAAGRLILGINCTGEQSSRKDQCSRRGNL
jgi:hypothetical protein